MSQQGPWSLVWCQLSPEPCGLFFQDDCFRTQSSCRVYKTREEKAKCLHIYNLQCVISCTQESGRWLLFPHGKKRLHVHVWRGEAQTNAGSLRQESIEEDWAARWPPCTIKEDYSIMIRSVFLSIKKDIYSACIIGKRHNVLSTSTGHTIPFSRASSQPRDQAQVSCIAGGFLASWATREAQVKHSKLYKVLSRIKRHDPGELWTIWS